MKTSLILFSAVFLLVGCGPVEKVQPRQITEEQQQILTAMSFEHSYYVKDCYLTKKYYTFSDCLEQKEKLYHPVPQTESGVSPLGAAAMGYVAGAVIHGGKK